MTLKDPEARKAYARAYYHAHKHEKSYYCGPGSQEHNRQLTIARKDYRSQRYLERKLALDVFKVMMGCLDCGYRENPHALQFDHVRGVKLFNLAASSWGRSMAALIAEIEKCEVRCANCHLIKTHPQEWTPA